MDGRAAALPVDNKPGFLFVQRRQSSSAVHPVQSGNTVDEAEKENNLSRGLGTSMQIDAFRVLAQASAKDIARPAPATWLGGERGASVNEHGAAQRAGAATSATTATPLLEPITMPSMKPSSAPFLTLGGIRLRRKPRPVRVSSMNRGLGHTHTNAELKAPTAVLEASRSQLLQQERVERLQRAGRAKASRKEALAPPSSIRTHNVSLDLHSDMLDCVVSDRHRKGTHQA